MTEILELYDEIINECPRFKRKGKSVPNTSANGHMFSFINKDGELGMRFSKATQEAYFIKYNTTFLKSHGAIMNGYILITEELLQDKKTLINLLNESYDYVMSLKTK